MYPQQMSGRLLLDASLRTIQGSVLLMYAHSQLVFLRVAILKNFEAAEWSTHYDRRSIQIKPFKSRQLFPKGRNFPTFAVESARASATERSQILASDPFGNSL